jgi:type II secretory pathway pseudopilin PulG
MGKTPPSPQQQPPVQVLPPLTRKSSMSTGCVVWLVAGVVLVSVGVIVALIATLAIPSFERARQASKKKQAFAEMREVKLAVEAFKAEYQRVPVIPAPLATLDGEERDSSDSNGQLLLSILLGEDEGQNPKKIHFWKNPPPSDGTGAGYTEKGGLIDAWGTNGYRILLDDNNDGRIADPEKIRGDVSAAVLLYSAGPDGDFSTWKDNLRSW